LDTSRGERLEDTKASFTVVGSWTAYDLTQVAASLTGFWGATFDGQYIYLVPTYNGVRAIASGKRDDLGETAPAHGLVLEHVELDVKEGDRWPR
jgi:hypothetical protein